MRKEHAVQISYLVYLRCQLTSKRLFNQLQANERRNQKGHLLHTFWERQAEKQHRTRKPGSHGRLMEKVMFRRIKHMPHERPSWRSHLRLCVQKSDRKRGQKELLRALVEEYLTEFPDIEPSHERQGKLLRKSTACYVRRTCEAFEKGTDRSLSAVTRM